MYRNNVFGERPRWSLLFRKPIVERRNNIFTKRSLVSGIEPETNTLKKYQKFIYIRYVSISKTNTQSEIFTNKKE